MRTYLRGVVGGVDARSRLIPAGKLNTEVLLYLCRSS